MGDTDLEKIVDGNAPFEHKPPTGFPPGKNKIYQRGVLLTRPGGSPYFMRYLAEFFPAERLSCHGNPVAGP